MAKVGCLQVAIALGLFLGLCQVFLFTSRLGLLPLLWLLLQLLRGRERVLLRFLVLQGYAPVIL